MDPVWIKNYPKDIAPEIDHRQFDSINDLFLQSCQKWRDRTAFINMGAELTFDELNYLSADFASFLQNSAGLKKGDRIAIQMPNLLQYPVVLYGALRAGLVVVNTNPLYTAREMRHQFKDSGAKALVVCETAASLVEEVLPDTDLETVVVTGIGDMLGFPKSWITNAVVRHVKKMVPSYNLPKSIGFWQAMDAGSNARFTPVECNHEDLAFLQYTGGTTGVAKGAMLTHKNIIANMLQMTEWMKPMLEPGKEIVILPLPLYHIFSLTVNGLGMFYYGGTNVMITNPRDIPGFIDTLKKYPFSIFVGLNTLFNALMNHQRFSEVDFSQLKIAVAGGMALQKAISDRWRSLTGSVIIEGYGLTEASPIVSCNPIDGRDRAGSIGFPLSSTQVRFVDDSGKELPLGETGELLVKGPQVMRGYWQRDDETEKVLSEDGWLKTGDVAVMDPDGYMKIVDRKKDMILVSGFNVYPNEVEDVVASHPKVLEVAAVGVPDAKSTEAVKIFVVRRDASLTEDELREFCHKNLTGYKLPKYIEFRTELPKTNVGKILRRELRDAHT